MNVNLIKYFLLSFVMISLQGWASQSQIRPIIGQQNTPIRISASTTEQTSEQGFYLSLLKASMQLTADQFGQADIINVKTDMTQERTLFLLSKGKEIDVIWTMTSKEREQLLTPIRVPLSKGLIGMRLLLISQGNQGTFNDITKEKQLKKLMAGQAFDWPDTNILKSNGYRVLPANSDKLVDMLKRDRFDYYPRSIREIKFDLAKYDGIEVESSLLLLYHSPIYFFVAKHNEALAKRIKIGLETAIDNGEFDRLLEHYIDTQAMFKKYGIADRTIFKLTNPSLTSATRALLKQARYWHEDMQFY
jgi:hypothetical protein